MVWVFHGMRGRAAQLSIGLSDSDRPADALVICDKQLRNAWHVHDPTEKTEVTGQEEIGPVQEEGRRSLVPGKEVTTGA